MSMQPAERYTAVAIVLHWLIAAAILGNIALGWWMRRAVEASATRALAVEAFQLHKSIGLTVLILSLLRLAWRLGHPPPALPAAMPLWERAAARATHALFYVLMIALPLTGWLYVSAQWRGDTPLQVPTLWFGLFEVPHLFGLNEQTRAFRETWAATTVDLHTWLAWSTAALAALHVGAALKHQWIDRDAVLTHMLPRPGWRVALASGIGLILLVGVGAALLRPDTTRQADTPRDTSEGADTADSGGAPGEWRLLRSASAIRFAGEQGGSAFNGRFERWGVDVRIDSDAVPESSINATIETASATDGVAMHDRALHEKEWFDVANHPVATFESRAIRPLEADRYAVDGVLTIKGNAIDIPPLTLSLDDNTATVTGRLALDRAEADLGMASDPEGEWVSREIEIRVRAVLSRRAAGDAASGTDD